MLVTTKQRPVLGQFIAIWAFKGVIWSGVFRYNDEELERYSESNDEWELTPREGETMAIDMPEHDITYMIKE